MNETIASLSIILSTISLIVSIIAIACVVGLKMSTHKVEYINPYAQNDGVPEPHGDNDNGLSMLQGSVNEFS